MRSMSDTRQPMTATTIRDFDLLRVLGKGCAGKVLLVRQRATKNIYALKAIQKRHVLAHQELQHTLTEQAVLARTSASHAAGSGESGLPFIVKLWYSFHDRENLYLVMDFHPGGDLATQLARWGRLGTDRARFYAAEIVEGIEALHSSGIIYRDLKPENVLIGQDGHIVLSDFGLSKEFPRPEVQVLPPHWLLPSSTNSMSVGQAERRSAFKRFDQDTATTFCGTAEYLSPEVISGQPYSYEVDWWSFGTMLYEMLAGYTPFAGESHTEMYVRVLREPLLFPDPMSRGYDPTAWDQDTRGFLRGLLQKDPGLRLQEPRLKKHPYFGMIEWDHIRYKRYIPPYVPPTDPHNQEDTRNFDETFLGLRPNLDFDDDESDDPEASDTDDEPTNNGEQAGTASLAKERARRRREKDERIAQEERTRLLSQVRHAAHEQGQAEVQSLFEGYDYVSRSPSSLTASSPVEEYVDDADQRTRIGSTPVESPVDTPKDRRPLSGYQEPEHAPSPSHSPSPHSPPLPSLPTEMSDMTSGWNTTTGSTQLPTSGISTSSLFEMHDVDNDHGHQDLPEQRILPSDLGPITLPLTPSSSMTRASLKMDATTAPSPSLAGSAQGPVSEAGTEVASPPADQDLTLESIEDADTQHVSSAATSTLLPATNTTPAPGSAVELSPSAGFDPTVGLTLSTSQLPASTDTTPALSLSQSVDPSTSKSAGSKTTPIPDGSVGQYAPGSVKARLAALEAAQKQSTVKAASPVPHKPTRKIAQTYGMVNVSDTPTDTKAAASSSGLASRSVSVASQTTTALSSDGTPSAIHVTGISSRAKTLTASPVVPRTLPRDETSSLSAQNDTASHSAQVQVEDTAQDSAQDTTQDLAQDSTRDSAQDSTQDSIPASVQDSVQNSTQANTEDGDASRGPEPVSASDSNRSMSLQEHVQAKSTQVEPVQHPAKNAGQELEQPLLRSEQPEQADQAEQAEQPEQPEQPKQLDQLDQSDQFLRRVGHAEQPMQCEEDTPLEEPKQPEQASEKLEVRDLAVTTFETSPVSGVKPGTRENGAERPESIKEEATPTRKAPRPACAPALAGTTVRIVSSSRVERDSENFFPPPASPRRRPPSLFHGIPRTRSSSRPLSRGWSQTDAYEFEEYEAAALLANATLEELEREANLSDPGVPNSPDTAVTRADAAEVSSLPDDISVRGGDTTTPVAQSKHLPAFFDPVDDGSQSIMTDMEGDAESKAQGEVKQTGPLEEKRDDEHASISIPAPVSRSSIRTTVDASGSSASLEARDRSERANTTVTTATTLPHTQPAALDGSHTPPTPQQAKTSAPSQRGSTHGVFPLPSSSNHPDLAFRVSPQLPAVKTQSSIASQRRPTDIVSIAAAAAQATIDNPNVVPSASIGPLASHLNDFYEGSDKGSGRRKDEQDVEEEDDWDMMDDITTDLLSSGADSERNGGSGLAALPPRVYSSTARTLRKSRRVLTVATHRHLGPGVGPKISKVEDKYRLLARKSDPIPPSGSGSHVDTGPTESVTNSHDLPNGGEGTSMPNHNSTNRRPPSSAALPLGKKRGLARLSRMIATDTRTDSRLDGGRNGGRSGAVPVASSQNVKDERANNPATSDEKRAASPQLDGTRDAGSATTGTANPKRGNKIRRFTSFLDTKHTKLGD